VHAYANGPSECNANCDCYGDDLIHAYSYAYGNTQCYTNRHSYDYSYSDCYS
jgi:hypothetical protein